MIPKKRRISSSFFTSLKTNGKTIKGKNASLLFLHQKDIQGPLFSVVISKKLTKTAILRNKIRRKVYNLIADIPISKDLAVIVFIKSVDMRDSNFSELLSEIDTIFKNLK